MKPQSIWMRPIAIGAGAGAVLVPLLGSTGAAFASTPSCADEVAGATEVATGICQVAFATHGSFTFHAPSGVTKLSAIVVGAGGGGTAPFWQEVYGGGGGSVVFVDSVVTSAPVSVTVGQGGPVGIAGGSSSVNSVSAQGGGGATSLTSGASQTHPGIDTPEHGASGAGFGGAAIALLNSWNDQTAEAAAPGEGVTMASVSGSSKLFGLAGDTQILGAGGAVTSFGYSPAAVRSSLPGSGGVSNGPATDSGTAVATPGTDGTVYLRWSAELANTGSNTLGYLWAGIGAIAVGLIAFASTATSRRTSSRKH